MAIQISILRERLSNIVMPVIDPATERALHFAPVSLITPILKSGKRRVDPHWPNRKACPVEMESKRDEQRKYKAPANISQPATCYPRPEFRRKTSVKPLPFPRCPAKLAQGASEQK
jgi:hypothetical protein